MHHGCIHRGRGEAEDGFYTITVDGTELEVYCDMTTDGGGWTLLVTSESQGGTWDDDTVLLLNADSPSITSNYSILQYICELDEEYRC